MSNSRDRKWFGLAPRSSSDGVWVQATSISVVAVMMASCAHQPAGTSASAVSSSPPSITRKVAVSTPQSKPRTVITSVGAIGFFVGEPPATETSHIRTKSSRISYTLRRYEITSAQVSSDEYYKGIDPSAVGGKLKNQLYNKIKGHKEYPYTSSARPDVWDGLKEIDADPNRGGYVLTIYSGESLAADDHGTGDQAWNREHVWAKSRGNFGTSQGAGTDLHHLRAEDSSVNSTRNNRSFDVGGSPVKDKDGNAYRATNCKSDSQRYTFEPGDSVKGDVARMIFYMAVRYEGEGKEPDLEIVNTNPSKDDKSPKHGVLSTLLAWHRNDPVSDLERSRNEKVFEWQGNRNPFIDHPEWVSKIWN